MKWVDLSCGHSCWVSFLVAFVDREVLCPGSDDVGGPPRCVGTPQRITYVTDHMFRPAWREGAVA